ncbi:MAG: hypothetical protein F4X98_16725 [Gammaproteobacteria bacterium]|nr:hypothetical protein [Gammaproteobacteria bacterium]
MNDGVAGPEAAHRKRREPAHSDSQGASLPTRSGTDGWRYGIILLVGLLVSACAGQGPSTPAPVVVPAPTPEPVPVPPPPPSIEPVRVEPPPSPVEPASTITQALVEEASRFVQAGSPGEAAAAIEEAIRVEPRRPELWLQLAALRLQEGLPANAEQNARKALLFVRRGSQEERNAWLLIADARAAQGDVAGADAIRDQWIASP